MENLQPKPSSNIKDQPEPAKKPNENGYVHVDGFVRISDPETQKIFVEIRE